MLFLLGCTEPHSSTPTETTGTPDTGEADTVVEHCGTISGDQTWAAGKRHLVSCNVEVDRGVLTVGAGAEVTFDENMGLKVGKADYDAGFVVDGASGGVSFSGSGPSGWDGIELGPFATTVDIAGLSMRDAAAGFSADGATIKVAGLGIEGAAGAGLTLEGGARFTDDSNGVVVTGSGDWGVLAEVATADSLPSIGSAYSGNAYEGIYLSGDTISDAVEWENLGVPYVISDNVEIEGNAGEPAIFTIGDGAAVLFEHDRQWRFSRKGNASQLVVNGTAESPVTFGALGADTAGYWKGIEVSVGASEVELHHALFAGAGEDSGAALRIQGASLWVDNVAVSGSAGAGILLSEGARFDAASTGLTVTASAWALTLPAAAVATIPTDALSLTGNDASVIKVSGDSAVGESGVWPNPGIPYWIADDITVNGTADSPVILEISAGVEMLFDNDTALFVGKSGAAGLLVEGTVSQPVMMEPWAAEVAGAWGGIGIYDASLDESVVLNHLQIGFAGGSSLRGNVHLDNASPALESVYSHDSLEWGLYLTGDSAPTLADLTWAANVSGDCNACL